MASLASLFTRELPGLRCTARLFFFQAEDGIRGGTVTGVQTCALPISTRGVRPSGPGLPIATRRSCCPLRPVHTWTTPLLLRFALATSLQQQQVLGRYTHPPSPEATRETIHAVASGPAVWVPRQYHSGLGVERADAAAPFALHLGAFGQAAGVGLTRRGDDPGKARVAPW